MKYFHSRPRDSQLVHGFQSSPVAFLPAVSLKEIPGAEAEVSTGRSAIAELLGGFRVSLEQIEFWQGGEHRLMTAFCTSVKMMRGRLIVLPLKRCKNLALIAGTPDSGTLFMSLSHLAKSRVPAKVQSLYTGDFDGKQ